MFGLGNILVITPQIVIGNISTIEAKAVEAKIASPAIIVIGETVKLSPSYWLNDVISKTKTDYYGE